MPTFFFRNKEMKQGIPNYLETARIVGCILHLCIPVVVYHILYKDLLLSSNNFLTKHWNITITVLHNDRKLFYMFLDVFYSIRWAIGCLIMNSKLTLPIAVFVTWKHLCFDELGYIVSSMLEGCSWGYKGSDNPLSIRDYICGFGMIVAGILQHYSELQRWYYKLDSKNAGKIYTGGLFSFARGINHTGHVLRDIAHLCLCPNLFFIVFYPIADYDLLFQIYPETQKHMKQKYGTDQWLKYEQQTPYIYLPGIY